MSFKAPSIKQQFENRNKRNESYDENYNPTEGERFRKEAEEFVQQVNMNKEIILLRFTFCPLDFIGKNLSIWFEKFPKFLSLSFKHPEFYWNGKYKTKTEYSVTRFYLLQYSKE
eukprot:snap_masked-scaffold_85-processed-gene-0.7-mRNA-1 protein AED:1.00 eAED:1.00 QI:0/0/0/0/1/1/5/0/113